MKISVRQNLLGWIQLVPFKIVIHHPPLALPLILVISTSLPSICRCWSSIFDATSWIQKVSKCIRLPWRRWTRVRSNHSPRGNRLDNTTPTINLHHKFCSVYEFTVFLQIFPFGWSLHEAKGRPWKMAQDLFFSGCWSRWKTTQKGVLCWVTSLGVFKVWMMIGYSFPS